MIIAQFIGVVLWGGGGLRRESDTGRLHARMSGRGGGGERKMFEDSKGTAKKSINSCYFLVIISVFGMGKVVPI